MQRWTRRALSGAAVVGAAVALLAVGAAGSPPAPSGTEPAGNVAPDGSIAALQADLERVPGDFRSWTALGGAYVQQARLTADPSYYAKAEGAFDKALALRPEDDGALTGQATLAAARHDFAGAVALSDRALAVNPDSATTWAVRSDALNELGRYDESLAAVRRMADLRPGADTSSRASYAFELRGDVDRARAALEEAVQLANLPADKAFAQYYLGELAWNTGDVEAARTAYEAGLSVDPSYLPLLAGRAKVLAAQGDTTAALGELRTVVERLPAPEFLVAYGELLEATGQSEQAQEQYDVVRATQRLFAANGQDVDTELALFEADHGTPAAAVVAAEKAHAKRPLSIFTQDAYAWALHQASRSAQALPIARQAVRLGLPSPALYYRLGTIEAAAGETAAARISLQKALSMNPDFDPLRAPEAKALLGSLR
ncbi:MAG: tetratricopeptide repeat protein [Mycobacteriales bacterium]